MRLPVLQVLECCEAYELRPQAWNIKRAWLLLCQLPHLACKVSEWLSGLADYAGTVLLSASHREAPFLTSYTNVS